MNNPLQNPHEYEKFIYALAILFPSIRTSTLRYISQGAKLGKVKGEIFFDYGFRIVVREILDYDQTFPIIDDYGYEIWRDDEKLFWYDPQPHPNDKSLANNHPHHKHIPPDIKHHRIPALQMSFTQSNLPALIQEIEDLIRNVSM